MQRLLLISFIAGMTAAYFYFHRRSILQGKESRLREDLFALRTVVSEYAFDQRKAPRTVGDLLQQRYLREMPVDPITGSSKTWRIVMENSENAIDNSAPGIREIKSGSTKTGLNGKRYSDW